MVSGEYKFVCAKTGSNEKGDYAFISIIGDSGDILKLYSGKSDIVNRVKKIKQLSDVTVDFELGEFKGYPKLDLVGIAEVKS